MFYFDILNFKNFIMVIYVFEIYHFDPFLKFKVNKILTFVTEKKQNNIFQKHK